MNHLVIALVRLYQHLVSPALPACCIYSPSCSHYAVDALRRHGFWKGIGLTVRRLVRCGPWRPGGFDPVP